jgi:hypothetical protein
MATPQGRTPSPLEIELSPVLSIVQVATSPPNEVRFDYFVASQDVIHIDCLRPFGIGWSLLARRP